VAGDFPAKEAETEGCCMKVVDSPLPRNVWAELYAGQRLAVPEGYESREQIQGRIGRRFELIREQLRHLVAHRVLHPLQLDQVIERLQLEQRRDERIFYR